MTDDRSRIDDPSALAGEYALGVLTGEELRQARELAASDAAFRAEVERWTGTFALYLEEVPGVDPPRQLWPRIAAAAGLRADQGNVVYLRRNLKFWRGAAVGMTGLAACLALFLVLRVPVAPVPIQRPPITAAPAAPMVAVIGDERETKVVASWDPNARQLILAVAGKLAADPTHSHELWVIPPGDKPVSLGVLPGSNQSHVRLADALAARMTEGATIAISVEPRGGSSTGAPTGPVIASGPLTPA